MLVPPFPPPPSLSLSLSLARARARLPDKDRPVLAKPEEFSDAKRRNGVARGAQRTQKVCIFHTT